MNIVFGIGGHAGSERRRFETTANWLAATYEGQGKLVCNSYSSGIFGTFHDGGKIIGTAKEGGLCLVFMGVFPKSIIQHGFPSGSSPLDEPNKVASFLLDRFRKHEKHFLDSLPGSFVVFVFDEEKKKLFLGCDSSCSRRMFYSQQGAGIVFGTTLSTIATLLGGELKYDRSYEDFLLGFEFLPWSRTPYRDVFSLKGGKLLEWNGEIIQFHEISPPHRWSHQSLTLDFQNASETETMNALYDAFMEALNEQTSEEKRVGVLLGGFDSALISSALTRLGKEVHTFSFYFEDSRFNQPHTDTLSTFIGSTHHWVPITPTVIAEGLRRYALEFNQPVSQPHYLIETLYACQVVRKNGLTSCFTGDGCDGIFLGYPTVHRRAKLFMALGKWPRPLSEFILRCLDWSLLEQVFGHPYRVARNVFSILSRPYPTRNYIASRIFDEASLRHLRAEERPEQEVDVETILKQLASAVTGTNPLRLAYLGKGAVGLNKNKLEGCSAVSGLILQSPYLHPGIIEFVNKLPLDILRPDGDQHQGKAIAGKYILSKMAEEKKLLPPAIIYQKKRSPVHAPVDGWYAGQLKALMEELVGTLPFRYHESYVSNLLKPKWAEELYRKYVSIDHLASHAAAMLVTYASFHRAKGETPR